MIKRDRSAQLRPRSLDLTVITSAGAKERAKVEAWINANRTPSDARPDFKAYKSDDVGPALEALFDRKCAYCESPYASMHPVDVEHWRPKADVEGTAGALGRGYEWLAMVWENLLPSCIDCNRARRQMIPDQATLGGWVQQKVGKANQFPVADEAKRLSTHNSVLADEAPLILDPCTDDPTEYFDFEPDGVLLPKAGLDTMKRSRAIESIRVYALNRKGLVDERKRHILYMELEFRLIRFLFEASADATLPQTHRDAANALVIESLDRLRERTNAAVPFSQFIAQRLRTFLKDELGVG